MRQVAVIAYACDPNLPSEPAIGWNFVQAAIAVSGDDTIVHVFTNRQSADACGSELEATSERVTLHVIELPRFLRELENRQIGVLARLRYLIWAHRAWRTIRRLCVTKTFEWVHHSTFASEMLPSPVGAFPDSTFKVWGPIGSEGNEKVFSLPPNQKSYRIQRNLQRLRNVCSKLAIKCFGRKVDLIVTQSRGVTQIAENAGYRALTFPNLLIGEDLIDVLSTHPNEPSSGHLPLKVLCVGHHLPCKRFDIALEIAAFNDPELVEVVFIGAPPARSKTDLEAEAMTRNIVNAHFLGKVPRAEVVNRMLKADVLFHPSAREGASGVVGEAISAGLPVVCFDGTGAAQLLRSMSGSGIILDAGASTYITITESLFEAAKRRVPRKEFLADAWGFARFVGLLETINQLAKVGASSAARDSVNTKNRVFREHRKRR